MSKKKVVELNRNEQSVEEARKERADKCLKEINDSLERHRCKLVPVVAVTGTGMINGRVEVVSR